MEKHVLSKSTFIRGVQCLKSLYLNKKRPFLRDKLPQERLLVFKRGHRVGELAQQLFPGGINMSPGHPSAYRKAILNTQEKIIEGFPVIYEAGFQHDQVMILLDILVQSGMGWHAYEVKSSGSISETYLMDTALQYFVITGTGLDLSGISVIHIDKDYVLEGEMNIHRLFKIVDVTDEALSRQAYITEQILKEKETLLLSGSPKIAVGDHCHEPYDCDFIGHCWKNIPLPERMPQEDQIDTDLLGEALQNEERSAYIRLLPIRPAIPMYEGTRPYQQIIYGYGVKRSSAPETAFFAHNSNPSIKLKDAINRQLTGIDTLFCFGQSDALKEIIEKDISIIDLKKMILPESEFHTRMEDKPELEKLQLLFRPVNEILLPEYTSDAIAEHYYLTELTKEGTKEKLKEYAEAWVQALEAFYRFYLQTGSG